MHSRRSISDHEKGQKIISHPRFGFTEMNYCLLTKAISKYISLEELLLKGHELEHDRQKGFFEAVASRRPFYKMHSRKF